MKVYCFIEPQDAHWILRLDNGFTVDSIPDTHPDNGAACLSFTIPDDTIQKNGASLTGSHPSYFDEYYHGILYLNEPVAGRAMLMIDIFKMQVIPPPVIIEVPAPPDNQGLDPNRNPLEVIHYVEQSTNPNLATVPGCGLFTEDVVKELHDTMHPAWGHVKKFPGQNQFNEHGVDSIMLLVPSGGTAPGIYDIIYSSAGPDALVVFNYAGPAEPDLWFYPPQPISVAMLEEYKHSDAEPK